MSLSRTRCLPALALAALCAGPAVLLAPGCDSGGNEFAPPPPPPVTTAHPAQREVAEVRRLIGRVEAEQIVEVRARVRGFIRERRFEPGDLVEPGAVLFMIEPEEFQARVDAATATLARANVAAELARIKLERTRQAAAGGAATQLEVLQVEAEHNDAKAAILEAEASLETAKINLDYTAVTAPIAGRLAENTADVGDLVGANDPTMLTRVVADRRMYVYFQVSERDMIAYLRDRGVPRDGSARGTIPVSLLLADGSPYGVQGVIDYLDPQLDRTTGTVTLRAAFDNPEGVLVSGMVVRVQARNEARPALLVPEAAVLRDLAGAYVFTVDDESVARRAAVTLGERHGDEIVVVEGVGPEDRVIVGGTQRVREGLAVAPAAAPSPSPAPGQPG